MDVMNRIELDPRVCNGRPVIKGTRIPVAVILERLSTGESWADLLAEYPELEERDIQAAMLYARAAIENSEIESRTTGG